MEDVRRDDGLEVAGSPRKVDEFQPHTEAADGSRCRPRVAHRIDVARELHDHLGIGVQCRILSVER